LSRGRGSPWRDFVAHEGRVKRLAFVCEDLEHPRLASLGIDGTLKTWCATESTQGTRSPASSRAAARFRGRVVGTVAEDGQAVFLASEERIAAFKPDLEDVLWEMERRDLPPLISLSFEPPNMLIGATAAGNILAWDAWGGERQWAVQAGRAGIAAYGWLPGPRPMVLACSYDRQIYLGPPDGAAITPVAQDTYVNRYCRFSSSGRWFVTYEIGSPAIICRKKDAVHQVHLYALGRTGRASRVQSFPSLERLFAFDPPFVVGKDEFWYLTEDGAVARVVVDAEGWTIERNMRDFASPLESIAGDSGGDLVLLDKRGRVWRSLPDLSEFSLLVPDDGEAAWCVRAYLLRSVVLRVHGQALEWWSIRDGMAERGSLTPTPRRIRRLHHDAALNLLLVQGEDLSPYWLRCSQEPLH
jgi:hypothetical protein